MPSQLKKRRRRNANALVGYARTESFTRISGYTFRDPQPQIFRGRIITVVIFSTMVFTGLYFVLF